MTGSAPITPDCNVDVTALPGIRSSALVRRCAFSLLARGDSLNGWPFKMHSKAVFDRREDAEAYMLAFRAACCDQRHFECADERTLKVEIIERDLYSPND